SRSYGLENSVSFAGWLDHRRVSEEYARSQCFAFPSLREFGGGVVLEALASGLPTVVVDYGGPAELVTPECSICLPMVPRAGLVPRLRRALEALVQNPDRCREMGRAACQLVRQRYTWPAKAGRIVEIYRQVVSRES